MMWNTVYGMAAGGGIMGGLHQPNGAMTVSRDKAASIAQGWLDRNLPGATAKVPDTFHGYYTIDYLKGSSLAGMLSVNGYSGQVWQHTWHGAFVQLKDLGQ
jgi:hypothetical protein